MAGSFNEVIPSFSSNLRSVRVIRWTVVWLRDREPCVCVLGMLSSVHCCFALLMLVNPTLDVSKCFYACVANRVYASTKMRY
jgi:hypothetical protein